MSTSLTEYITNINLEADESENYILVHQPASGETITVTYTINGTSTTETFTYGTSASGTYITYDGDITFTFTAVSYTLVGVSITYTGDVIYYANGSDKSRAEVYTKDDIEDKFYTESEIDTLLSDLVDKRPEFIEFTGSISSVSAGGTASNEFSLSSDIGISDGTGIAVVAAAQTGTQSNRTWLHYPYPYVSIRSNAVTVTVINNLSVTATISFRIIFIVLN